MEEVKKSKSIFPQLGMAGISGASILVCVSQSELSYELKKSIWWFSIAIPLILGSAYARIFSNEAPEMVYKVVKPITELGSGLGDLIAAIGFYWLISHASQEAADLFLKLAMGLWLCVGIFGLWVKKVSIRA